MATGRNNGYYNQFSDNQRLANGRDRDGDRVGGVKERGLVNRSDSGGSGECRVRVGDREPGELYSSDSGSDKEAVSDSLVKKRKFSPIVWDRDDKEVASISKSRLSTVNRALSLPPLPPLPKSYKQSPNCIPTDVVQVTTIENDEIQIRERVSGNTPVGLSSSPLQKEDVGLSFSPAQEENYEYVQKVGKPEDEDYMPARNIGSSRWANDANSPVDEGELSDALGNNGIQRRRKTPSGSIWSEKQEWSPDIGELNKEGSERDRARLTKFYENGYHSGSSSSDDHFEKEDNGLNVGESYNDSESDDGAHGSPQHIQPPQRSVNMLRGCRSVDEFERLNKIDEGTYGVVFRAKDKKTGEVVALKKVKMEKEREGFPLTSLREINILLSFDHPSVIDVKEVVVGSNLDSIFMVMEYMEHDLKALMETMKQPFSQSEVKCLMLQLLEGTKYLHDNWVLHRDLKTSNILLNNRGELKICDFGLSRQYGSPLKPYTQLVVTLWYRAPELLLGAKQYSTAIDMWSLGCIMAELLSKQPLFNGKTEFDQLDKIFKTLGTPNESIWPGFSKLSGVKLNFVKNPYNLLRRKFPATSFIGSPVLSDSGFDLLNKLLTYNPEQRITAEAALNHEWFREVPLPKSKDFMPTFPAHHAQDRRTRRVMKSPDPLEEQRRKELQQAKIGTGGLFG